MRLRPDGTKELIAIEDSYRESTESWAAVLYDVWPETQEQRCWVHRIANVLDKLPKRLHSKAKAALHETSFSCPVTPARCI
jgi:transposase-like protein